MKKILVLLFAVMTVLFNGVGHAEDVMVAVGKKVKFDYTLTVNKEVVESSKGKQPLEYNPGRGELIPGLEKEMLGMKVGDAKTVVVKPEDGYGIIRSDAFRDFDRAKLPKDMEPKVGMVLEMQDETGTSFPAKVAEVSEKSVKLDFNHPLAGKELTFDVKVVSIE
ncbi:MAG: peptidylprolyl isomerase [Candidatus Omnitrophica bacterium]|nr:peptidylprolyl isomerase [Candidatus Omnitrophota bacterium]